MPDTRRMTPRDDAFRFGSVQAGAESGAVECMVWDISADGAMIEVDDPITLPDRLSLSMPGEAAPRAATVVWRAGRRLGLTF